MRSESPVASNWRAEGTLRDYLTRNNVVAISDIDTRALTRLLRSSGVMRGVIATGRRDPDELVERARGIPPMEGADLVKGVTCDAPFDFVPAKERRVRDSGERKTARRLRIAAYDLGMKWNILRRFCGVRLRRARVSGVRRRHPRCSRPKPDGVFLSNGPGDPAVLDYAIENARDAHRRATCRRSASASATRSSAWRWARRPSS